MIVLFQVDEATTFAQTSNTTEFVPFSWIHACVAVDSSTNQLKIVANGKQIEDKSFPAPEGEQPPTDLTGKLFLFKAFVGFWYQTRNKISNLNIFSRLLTLPEMVSRTSGDNCGKANGDYLAWEDTRWDLKGAARLGEEVEEKDLCRKISKIQLFTAPIGGLNDCMNLCANVQSGTLPPMRSRKESEAMFDRVAELLNPTGSKPTKAGALTEGAWAPIRQPVDGAFVDAYTGEPVQDLIWVPGHPASGFECAMYVNLWKGLASFSCSVNAKVYPCYCPCYFPNRPQLTLRGLCPNSFMDLYYEPRNDPVTGYLYFYGTHKTIATFDGDNWKMVTSLFNTTASTNAKPDTFILGRHSWDIDGDSKECHSGKPYTSELKMTGCAEGQFTCNDGQCVRMEERCNQLPNCRDESDEDNCQLLILKNNYNNKVPPITTVSETNFTIVPAPVYISVTLMKIVSIEEVSHMITLQFEIVLNWNEVRATYQNLKFETSLNALTDDEAHELWLPYAIFDNTDNKEAVQLTDRVKTTLVVSREGEFTRSGLEVVDEVEVFRGSENSLALSQTHSKRFQCQYRLNNYPFDTQVPPLPST